MAKFFSKACIICLLSLLFVTKSNATDAEWYCDPNNGTYSVMDLSYFHVSRLTDGLTMDLLLGHNPYRLYVPQNIAPGQQMVAHFKTHCVGFNAVNAFTITANARDAQRQAVASQSISCKTKKWTSDYAFVVPESTQMIDFTYKQNGNTKAKEVMFWIPMPLHLDVADQNFCEPVLVDDAIELRIPINTFFLEEGVRDITIAKTGNGVNCEDFEIVRGTVHTPNRCGTNRWVDHSQRRYFADTRLDYMDFIVRFTPSASGNRECEFVVTAGSQSKVIRVKAKAMKREVTFVTVGEGAVELYVNHSETPITESPYEFQKGDHLRFVAIPDQCNHFVNWSINPLHHFPVIDVIGQHSFVIHANFAPTIHSVVVVEGDEERGHVCYDKCPAHHFCGAQLLFTAHAKPGYEFVGWSTCDNPDSIISTEEQYLVELTDVVCLKANFEEEREDDGFRVVCQAVNGLDVTYNNYDPNIPAASFLYSHDRKNWYEYVNGTPIHLSNKGEKVYFKADSVNAKGVRGSFCDDNTADEDLSPAFFVTDTASVEGNIMYLIYNSGETAELPAYAFRTLFAKSKVCDASKLVLPSDSVSRYAYHSMFRACDLLTSIPVFPATKLSTGCYAYMFMNCTALEVAPELPAAIIPNKAYTGMFLGCTALTTVPMIDADSVEESGCSHMFDGCISLTDVPATLRPINLTPSCYEFMFSYCSSLVDAPALPATSLAKFCYKKMFRGCSSLETAPVLPATTLADRCYWSMFDGCSSLSQIEVGFSEFANKGQDTPDWTKGVAEEGTFLCPNMPEANQKRNNAAQNIYKYIPTLWSVNPGRQNVRRSTEESVDFIAIAEGMNIIVKGAEDATVSVYDAMGRLVSSVKNADNFETINVATPGVYFVSVAGKEATRVIVK